MVKLHRRHIRSHTDPATTPARDQKHERLCVYPARLSKCDDRTVQERRNMMSVRLICG